jgi:hypothetical protein
MPTNAARVELRLTIADRQQDLAIFDCVQNTAAGYEYPKF